jgi:hypothetical protein
LSILKPDIALNNFVDGALNKYIKRDYGTDWDPLTTLTPDERHVPEGVNNLARQGEPTLRSRNWPPIRFGSEAGTKKIIDGLRSTTRDLMQTPTGGYRTTGLRIDDVYKENPWLKEKPRDMELFYDFNPNYGAFPHLIDTLRRTITPDSGLPNELRLNPESLQRMSVLQASKLVGKVNQWDKAQAQAASQRLMLNPFKEYDSGYKWVKLPNAREPEGLKSVMDLGCKGGWCTQQEDQAKAYSNYARGDHLYTLLDPEGRPHAQVSTFEGDPHDWERNKNITSMQPLANEWDSQYVSDWMKKDPNYKNQIKGYMQDFAGSNDWTHNDRVTGMNAIDMITTNNLDDYFQGNNQAMPLVMALRNNPENVGGSDAVYLEALRRARQNASQREEKIPAYMTIDQSKNMIQQFMPRLDERERINAQVERLFQKPPVEGYAEGGRAMKDLKDEPAPNLYDLSKRSKTGIDVLDNMLDPFYAMSAGIDAQYLPEEVQWTDDDGNMHSYTAPGIANSALGIASLPQLFGGPEYPMADAASDAYNTGLQRALDHYGLPARNDMGFVNKTGLTLGEMLAQIPLVPLSAANKVRQGAQVVGGAMPFIKKALMAIPEYLGPTIEPTVANYAIGTAGGMAFPPAMKGLAEMYEKYSPELEYEVPDTDMRGMLDDIGNPIDRESDKRVAQWVAEQRGPSDERARIADNVRRSMMTPGFGKGGFNPKELAEKLAREAAERQTKRIAAEALAKTPGSTIQGTVRREYPAIYSNPKDLIAEASSRVPPESPDLKRLFGVTRGDLRDIAMARDSTIWLPPGAPKKPRGTRHAGPVMGDENTDRLINTLNEMKGTDLSMGMQGWYVMDPVYRQLEEMYGPDEALKQFDELNTLMGIHSANSDVMTEINLGTSANWLNQQGRLDDYIQYGGAAETPGRPEDMTGILGHMAHKTAHSVPTLNYLLNGRLSKEAKTPAYIAASRTPEMGMNTNFAVGDAHFSRGIGLGDVRPFTPLGDTEKYGASWTMPEAMQLRDWFSNDVAKQVGMQAVPAQASLWGALSGATGVDTAVGVPKLELLVQSIMQTARRLNISPEKARDLVISGRARAGYAEGGDVEMQDLQDMLDKYNQDTRVNYG